MESFSSRDVSSSSRTMYIHDGDLNHVREKHMTNFVGTTTPLFQREVLFTGYYNYDAVRKLRMLDCAFDLHHIPP